MRRPSFQFYPADWLGNTNLRRCTHAEKGAWLDVMCLMHDAEEYGVLRWPLNDIAAAVHCGLEVLQSLVAKAVLKGDDKVIDQPYIYVPRSGRKDGEPVTLIARQPGPLWYSSRMVRDEYVRQHRGDSSRFGAAEAAHDDSPITAPTAAPKPPFSDGSSSSSSSSSKNISCPPSAGESPAIGFDDFWNAYPRKAAKPRAEKAWKRLHLDINGIDALMAGLDRCKQLGEWQRDIKYVPHPATWLNDRRWEDIIDPSADDVSPCRDFLEAAI